jgi:hypothetical protein
MSRVITHVCSPDPRCRYRRRYGPLRSCGQSPRGLLPPNPSRFRSEDVGNGRYPFADHSCVDRRCRGAHCQVPLDTPNFLSDSEMQHIQMVVCGWVQTYKELEIFLIRAYGRNRANHLLCDFSHSRLEYRVADPERAPRTPTGRTPEFLALTQNQGRSATAAEHNRTLKLKSHGNGRRDFFHGIVKITCFEHQLERS